MVYRDLSIKEKADVIKQLVKSGITDLKTIEDTYNKNSNKEAYGGPLNYPFSKTQIPQVRYATGGPLEENINQPTENNYKVPFIPEWIDSSLEEPTEQMEHETKQYDWTDEDIINVAKVFESYRSDPYIGVKGDILGGYGHKLNASEKAEYWDSENNKYKKSIPKDIINQWLVNDMQESFDSIKKIYGDNIPSNIKAALVSLRYQGGEKLVRASRDKEGNIEKGSLWGSPKFEAAVKAYLNDNSKENNDAIIDQMQYKDDGDTTMRGLMDRYGLYRAMVEGIADPKKTRTYKFLRTFKLYRSNKDKK